jgi:glutamate-ammonia-ligase adenylyltransferase
MKAKGRSPARKRGSEDGALARRLVDVAPAAAESDAVRAVSEWLTQIARRPEGRSLKQLVTGRPAVGALLARIAGGSPYLWELARADAGRLVAILGSDPDATLAAIVAETMHAVAATSDEAEAMRLLRQLKSHAALMIALADIGGVWPIMQVTAALTRLADASVAAAVRFLLRDAIAAEKLDPADPARPEEGSGLIVLAMGKMGAFELNYSSDIDLIILFDPRAPALAKDVEAAPIYLRVARGLVKLLQERTGDGYVFRVDLRLRPDPASTQIAVSTDSALTYYESVGQNWERAAMIKARPCAGDIARGQAFLDDIAPFVWRKYFDFAAVADVHAM